MNCLYRFSLLIERKATLLSSQAWTSLTVFPWSAFLTLSTTFAALWPATNSNLGIVSPFLESHDPGVIRPCSLSDPCSMIA